ncbi:MAG: hypothetical protein ACRCSO_11300 [Sphingomonas sp.]
MLMPMLLLVGCGPQTDATGATPREARQLNEAAQSTDINQADADTSDGNERDAAQ